MKRILLSVPHLGGSENRYVREAFASNWLSTAGPHIDAFEQEIEARLGLPAAALASGTATLHLGLRVLGVEAGDTVFCSTLTFAASANPILYQGATPVFIDSDIGTWNMDPDILEEALQRKAATGKLPRAVLVVDLYGQCADMDRIRAACVRYNVPILEDAAEALGAIYCGRPAGTLGDVGVLSFNGNKIITTTGGGMLMSPNAEWVKTARFWSQQAREPGIGYTPTQLGFNYRLSNVLAAIGRGQLEVLDLRVNQRRRIAFVYRAALADVAGIRLMPQAPYGLHTNWLSCFLIDERTFGCSRDRLIESLDAAGIESRPVWKPMHLQPLYRDAECFGGEVATDLGARGICLPSSTSLTDEEILHVVNTIRRTAGTVALSEVGALEKGTEDAREQSTNMNGPRALPVSGRMAS